MNIRLYGLLALMLCLTVLSCTGEATKSEEHCSPELPVTPIAASQNLGITAPDDFGGTVTASDIYQDTLLYVLAARPKLEIKVVDLKNRRFVGGIPLDPNFIDSPSAIQVLSADSIFVSDFNFPSIRLINSRGEVLDTYNLYREDLWEMPKEGFANFGLYGGFGMDFEYLPERKSFLVPLRQLDQWYFVKEKKDFPAIGEYSLATGEFRVFGKYEGLYTSEENLLLPFYLSHPVVERVGELLILSFSMDPDLYLYSLDGEFLGKKCGSIPELGLSQPLRYDMEDYDSQGIMAYNSRSSYFGDFYHIPAADRYVRFFWNCNPDPEGNCKSKQAFALVFDRDLNLVEVREMKGLFGGNEFMLFQPFQLGFLTKTAERESDDEFVLNTYYSID